MRFKSRYIIEVNSIMIGTLPEKCDDCHKLFLNSISKSGRILEKMAYIDDV